MTLFVCVTAKCQSMSQQSDSNNVLLCENLLLSRAKCFRYSSGVGWELQNLLTTRDESESKPSENWSAFTKEQQYYTAEADLGMFSMFGRTGAPQKGAPHEDRQIFAT